MTARRPITTVLAGIALAAAAGLASAPARAAGPAHSTESLEFSIAEHPLFTEVCGFPVALHVWGSWNLVTWTGVDGKVIKEVRNFRFRSVSTANGVSVDGITMGPEIWTTNPDGTQEGQIMGVVNRRVPGQGTVTLFAGYELRYFDGDVEVVLAGPVGQREDAAMLCSAFTS